MDEEDDIIPLNCPSRKQFPVLRCVGFGLIRAINPERRLFYIITPVEQRQLAQVDVLALGHCLNTPQLIFDTNVRRLNFEKVQAYLFKAFSGVIYPVIWIKNFHHT